MEWAVRQWGSRLALFGGQQLLPLQPEEKRECRRYDDQDEHSKNEERVERRRGRPGIAQAEVGSRQHPRIHSRCEAGRFIPRDGCTMLIEWSTLKSFQPDSSATVDPLRS
jgi:hypothetical protein